MTAQVYIDMDEADRLFKEDISAALSKVNSAIKISPTPKTADFIVHIRRLEFDERAAQPQLQTVMYQDYQVDILQAALLMPRNATYMYDVASGSSELTYAFSLKIEKNGTIISDELIRDKATRQFSQCRNARIQNVFGGVQPANFVANDDMKRRCASNTSSIDRSDLRNEAIRRVATGIASIAPIKAVIEEGNPH